MVVLKRNFERKRFEQHNNVKRIDKNTLIKRSLGHSPKEIAKVERKNKLREKITKLKAKFKKVKNASKYLGPTLLTIGGTTSAFPVEGQLKQYKDLITQVLLGTGAALTGFGFFPQRKKSIEKSRQERRQHERDVITKRKMIPYSIRSNPKAVQREAIKVLEGIDKCGNALETELKKRFQILPRQIKGPEKMAQLIGRASPKHLKTMFDLVKTIQSEAQDPVVINTISAVLDLAKKKGYTPSVIRANDASTNILIKSYPKFFSEQSKKSAAGAHKENTKNMIEDLAAMAGIMDAMQRTEKEKMIPWYPKSGGYMRKKVTH